MTKSKRKVVRNAWIVVQHTPRGWVPCPTINPFVYTSRSALLNKLQEHSGYEIVRVTLTYTVPLKTKKH